MKGTYGSDNFQEFTVNGIGQYSWVIKFDNYYAIACSENFFVGLYSSNLNLLNSISLADIRAEDTENIGLSEIKYKCTITKTKNNIIVGVIDDDKPTHGYKIFSFSLNFII